MNFLYLILSYFSINTLLGKLNIKHEKLPIGGVILLPYFILFIFLSYNDIFLTFSTYIIILLIIGTLDDLFNLKVYIRFLSVFIITFLFLFINPQLIQISSFNNENIFLIIFLTFLILGFIHTLNMIDGIDGLYIFYILICFFLILNLDKNFQFILLTLLFLLYLNLSKTIIIGNGGNLYISATVPILFLDNNFSIVNIFIFDTVINKELLTILFILPLLDGLKVTSKRISNSNSPFKKDRNHIQYLNDNPIFSLILISSSQILINLIYIVYENFLMTIIFSLIFYFLLSLFLINFDD